MLPALARDAGGYITRLTDDMVLAPEELANQISGPCLFVGDGVERYGEIIQERCRPHIEVLPLAAVLPCGSIVARLAWLLIQTGRSRTTYPNSSHSISVALTLNATG